MYILSNDRDNWEEKVFMRQRKGEEQKVYICDLLLLTWSLNIHFLQPEDLEVPTGGKNTENTSEKINSTTP